MKVGSRHSFRLFSVVTFVIIALILCAGCTINTTPKKTQANTTPADPVVGTWNGFTATSGDKVIEDPAIIKDVETKRLNVYPDLAFAYTTDFAIRNGTLTPTGKGNYVVKGNETDTERKYFRYNEGLDTLKWESRGMTIEFRRNDRSLNSTELSEYNTRMLEIYQAEQLAASATPVPKKALAQILSKGFGYDPTKSTVYQMNGNIEIQNGVYDSVGVIIRYPDRDTYQIDLGGMGGSNITRKDFKIVLHERVINQTPNFFVRLGSMEYPVVRTGERTNGIVYTAYEKSP
ncbi:MAG: hypothetical protein WC379_08970 [Methanoregula sp.]|jgi:hypothetical protein